MHGKHLTCCRVLCETCHMTTPVLAIAAIFLYALVTLQRVRTLRQDQATIAPASLLLLAAACLLHALALLSAWRSSGGIDLHFFAAISIVAWVTAALTAGLALVRPVAALGVVTYPIAMLGVVAYPLLAAPSTTRVVDQWQIQLHAGLSLLAYAALGLAALLAIMLWLQERSLRQRRLGGWSAILPPLTQVETLMFRLIAAGFLLLTLALLSGALFVKDLFAQHLVHKTVLSILAWTLFGALLYGRMRHGWRGRRAVRWTLFAMSFLALGFFGSKFVLELILARGG